MANTHALASPHADPIGSVWRRWDPHIHFPGTVLADNFKGEDPWEDALARIEAATPTVEALGITDYLSLELYEKVQASRDSGRLANVTLLFPNVEMRFAVNSGSGSPINFHLLISPEDPDHVKQAQRLLTSLTFAYGTPGNLQTYRCTRDDLILLGKAFKSSTVDDAAALVEGTNQFKVDPDGLLKALSEPWAQQNILIGVVAGSNDGTSQLQNDTGLSALRKKLESHANIIFSSRPKDREFWLGEGVLTLEQLRTEYGGAKPCLHGSDAHTNVDVAQPKKDRFCWIKGDLTFEALRQACIEPAGRAFVGQQPPIGSATSTRIANVQVADAPWLPSASVELNPGLVAIIGARGSGKSALVELIAAGGFALADHIDQRSFVQRAKKFVAVARPKLTWADGEATESTVEHAMQPSDRLPAVQYLSQQFVDQLCSAEGLSDGLVREIQRVVFDAHSAEDRLGASTFNELLDIRASRARAAWTREQQSILTDTDSLVAEEARRDSLDKLKQALEDKQSSVRRDTAARTALITAGNAARTARFEAVSAALESARRRLETATRHRQALLSLKDHVEGFRATTAPQALRDLKERHAATALTDEEWIGFELDFKGPVDAVLQARIAEADAAISAIRGPAAGEQAKAEALSTAPAYFADDADMTAMTVSLLQNETERLQTLVGIDDANTKRFSELTTKIAASEAEAAKLAADLALAEAAKDKIREIRERRRAAYGRAFQAVIDEETELVSLYAPLGVRIDEQSGTLAKLSFSVRRKVDTAAWARAGEALLDLRKGTFRGGNELAQEADSLLRDAWTSGTADAVSTAISVFIQKHSKTLTEQAIYDRSDPTAFSRWRGDVSRWLYNTDHIKVSYGVQYAGTDIEQHSPGTRGIILLLLYLAIDRDDDRPLVIDQPEENLDPKSIFDELVARFREAKTRRQIIIVTHNANLVVNTDADQVVVATAGTHKPGELPQITYESGGLENPAIRTKVCDILEGGEAAFKERARRLRVALPAY